VGLVTRIQIEKHVALRGREDVHRVIWSGNLRESGHLENLGLDGKIILKLILKKLVGLGRGSSVSGQG
jgi:hypothetical protein